jgi:hypothetical protein
MVERLALSDPTFRIDQVVGNERSFSISGAPASAQGKVIVQIAERRSHRVCHWCGAGWSRHDPHGCSGDPNTRESSSPDIEAIPAVQDPTTRPMAI